LPSGKLRLPFAAGRIYPFLAMQNLPSDWHMTAKPIFCILSKSPQKQAVKQFADHSFHPYF
jgi:hypothetical protein